MTSTRTLDIYIYRPKLKCLIVIHDVKLLNPDRMLVDIWHCFERMCGCTILCYPSIPTLKFK